MLNDDAGGAGLGEDGFRLGWSHGIAWSNAFYKKIKGATGVAFDASARAWVTARGRLYAIRPGKRKREKHPLRLGKGVSGAVAASGPTWPWARPSRSGCRSCSVARTQATWRPGRSSSASFRDVSRERP